MGLNKYWISLLFFIVSIALLAQESSHQSNLSSEDSLALERRKEYEARLNEIREIERRREKDPERFRDSVAQIRAQKRFEKATKRIEAYKRFEDLSQVVEIDLSDARLNVIPEWVFEAQNLEILVLNNNQILTLPRRLADFKSLRRIYWKNNGLGDAKPRIPRLEGIEKLDLTGNQLIKLPKVHRFNGLKELVLEDNEFVKIPAWRVRRLKKLKELDLSNNPIGLSRRWYGLIDHVEVLKLNKCEITSIHPSLYKMKGLTELQIQINHLKSVPEGISGLSNLTKLSFYKNDLKELPGDFFELDRLKVVDLYYNQFEKVPTEIAKLKELEILYLSFNALYDIPSEIGELSKLEELYIHHNRLSEIPKSIGKLKKLRVLHFQENYVPSFPNHILEMKSLVDLDISLTDIREIPLEITELELKRFYWRDLEIDLNNPDNTNTRKALLQLIKQGTKVVPNITIEEVSY